jgi:anthranilate/para-aminobenzoate synthase component I
MVLRCNSAANGATLVDANGVHKRWRDPLGALAWLEEQLNQDGNSQQRWVGFLSYDLVRLFEELPILAEDELGLPLFIFTLHDVSAPPSRSVPKLETTSRELSSTLSKSKFEAAVTRAIDYIRAGDVFQVNLSQRYSCGATAQPVEIFRRLQTRSPALYGACLSYEDFALISNSPELFLRIERKGASRTVLTRPIKGTRPHAPGKELELLNSLKDQAELNMIVDVERNDLGRICEIGSVKVVEPRSIESHPTVYHGVATVAGKLRAQISFVDILRATFPTGSVTGAPKIRAMQIVEELEPVRRGPYCGAIGYLGPGGEMEFSVAIRTITIKSGLAYVPVGGGIVADSDPAAEYEETLVKARAMFDALGLLQ